MGKNRKFKSENPGQPLPSVAIRRWAYKLVDDFCASGKDSQVIEQQLSNTERGIVHEMCRQMGLQSKSHGKGDQRRLSISKRIADSKEEKGGHEKKLSQSKLKCVSFPSEAKPLLHELFTRYPPCDSDATGTSLTIYTGNFHNQRKDDFFLKPQMTEEDIGIKLAYLSSRLANNKGFQQIFKARSKLPIASFRDVIISAVESNQVVLIAGETGCGKTTQVPQYLLDHIWNSKRKACKIICTQPRRISAISVSQRISWERGETIGNNIGYKVRLQNEGGRWSSVVFCTNGILLRVLVGKGVNRCVPDITHIIVDEIHERDCYSDFMLAILRDLLPSNPHLRLILMSATLDAERFSGYFGGCPVVRVPGFTYPVRSFFLEDALSVLESDKESHLLSAGLNIPGGMRDFKDEDKVALDEAIDLAWTNDDFDALFDLVFSEGSYEAYNYQNSMTGLTPLMVFAGKGRVSDVCKLLSSGADCTLKSKEGITALQLAEKENQFETAQIIREHAGNIQSNSQQAQHLLDNYMATINTEEVDVGLIVNLMEKICGESESGAVLVFLPGWEEIKKTNKRLLANPFFADSAKFCILCLHSKVPAEEQTKVFNHLPQGCRKIVLSTNIAESAVTIEDVVYVIDSGRMKENNYDPYNDVLTLQSSWVSKANAKQREGRAGRCQRGICYHLYSKLRAATLPEYREPEVRRMPVDELCLQVKMLDPSCNINDFLQKLVDPPLAQSIENSLIILKDIGALTPQEELTELGQQFGQLPVHPRISKMLYFAILVNCLDPAIILACAADTKDPFINPLLPDEKQKAAAAKRELASFYGDYSDHLAIVAAFQCWKNAKESGQAKKFCSKYFISPIAMMRLDDLRRKLQGELKLHGVIPSSSNFSLNAHDPGILRAVLAVGLYPMVGRMCPLSKNQTRSVVETITGAIVRVPSLSNNVDMSSTNYDEAIIVFDEITRGDWDVHIRSRTVLSAIPLLLFSREIAVSPTESYDGDKSDDEEDHEVENVGGAMDIDKADGRPGEKIMLAPENAVKVVVDRWLPFKITALEIAQMYILRERLMASILFKVKHPEKNLPPHLGASMYAIACILSHDGLTQSPVQTVEVVDATSLESANKSGLGNMEESLPSIFANGTDQPDPNTAPVEDVLAATQQKKMLPKSKRCKSLHNVDLGNIEENSLSDLANGSEQTEPKDLGNMEENSLSSDLGNGSKQTGPKDLGNMEENKLSSDLANGNEQKEPKSVSRLDQLGREKDSIPSKLADGNEQPDPNIALVEAASAAKQPQKKRSRSKKRKSANNQDLGNMEENKLSSDLANGNEQKEPNSLSRLDLLGREKDSIPSNPADGNEQPDPNSATVETDSAAKQPQKKRSRSKKRKSANNQDFGNMEENKLSSDLANGNEQKEPKSLSRLDLLGMEKDSIPSNHADGNEQPDPNSATVETDSAAKQPQKKRSRSKKRKSANNQDSVNMEENKLSSDLANGNEQKEPKSVSSLDLLGREKDSIPSSLADGNEQHVPNIALVEAASAAKQPGKKRSRSKKRKIANNLDSGNMEEKKPSSDLANGNEQKEPESVSRLDTGKEKARITSNLANGNEQPDPNTAPAAKKRRQKKRRLVNNNDLGNSMEEKMPSTKGIEQPDLNIAVTEAPSMVKQQKKEV